MQKNYDNHSNRNSITDNAEEFGWKDVKLRKIADGDIFRAKSQIFNTAEQGVCRFGAVF